MFTVWTIGGGASKGRGEESEGRKAKGEKRSAEGEGGGRRASRTRLSVDRPPYSALGTGDWKLDATLTLASRPSYSPRLQAVLEASRKQVREGEVLNHEEFWAEVEASRASEPRGRK